jgi:hypothetical protein
MKIKSSASINGSLTIVKTNEFGVVTDTIRIPNLVVTTGKALIANRLVNPTQSISHMAVGSGTNSPSVSNTSLQTQIGNRIELSSSTVVDNSVTFTASFGAGVSTGAITEAGLFNHLTGTTNNMLSRTTFPVVNKASGDSITISWVITIA